MKWLVNWIDDRTGVKELVHESLYENIPGGARWRYVSGSMLVFAFVTQVITGIFLWMFYSAGSQNAWASVYHIQNLVPGGWVLRGVHHFMAQAMVVLMPVHMMQVIWDKAYQKPREINYWLGLVLLLITMGLGLTGYLLPWDQKGYFATKVATELMALPPVVGMSMQREVVGGAEYGHFTLTRFFALHAGLLPALFVGVLALHLAMFRKHGITAESSPKRPDQYFWPQQVLKDGVACLVLFAVVLGIVWWRGGAELTGPAEPTEGYKAARPEWYFLFLFQALKLFHNEFVGAIVVPGLVFLVLAMMPLLARRKMGHAFNVGFMVVLFVTAAVLTYQALQQDYYARWYPDSTDKEKIAASQEFLGAKTQAHHDYERIKELIEYEGIPLEGPNKLLREDPEIMGPRLFARSCASCHSYLDSEGEGIPGPVVAKPDADGNVTPNGAPNLYGFASRKWIEDLLTPEKISSVDYFGNTIHGQKDEDGEYDSAGMVAFVHDNLADLSDEEKKNVAKVAAALSAEAGLIRQAKQDANASLINEGRQLLTEEMGCTDCHKLGEVGDLGIAPDLTGYGSAQWLRDMIKNPEHERLYGYEEGANDRMPAFSTPEAQLLTDHDIEMLVRWLRQDDRDLKAKLQYLQKAQADKTP
jgi:ubiquinol-cytochrome c reductase cytochrome b subunit